VTTKLITVQTLTPQEKVKRFFATVGINILPFLYALTCIVPLVWIFYSSLKSVTEFEANQISLPKAPSLYAYVTLFTETNIFTNIINSLRSSVISVFLVLLIGFINGYFLARVKFRGRTFLRSYYLFGLLVPIHALLVPTYILFSYFGLANSWYTLIFPYICCTMATTVYLVESYISAIPRELEESAGIDGASFSRTLFSIILPISRPILISAGIIAFFYCWNEFAYALVLISNDKLHTVPLALMAFKGRHRIDYPRMMAAMLFAMVPALLLYSAFSKQIIKGMVTGAIKG